MNKRNIAILTLIVIGLLASLAAAVPPPDDYDLDRILTAIRQQESGGEKNPNEAVGDNGASLGSFQISRDYWIDALDYDPSIGGEYEDEHRGELGEDEHDSTESGTPVDRFRDLGDDRADGLIPVGLNVARFSARLLFCCNWESWN